MARHPASGFIGIRFQLLQGRVKTPGERREAILEAFDQSGMSGQKFAKWAGIKYTTFANWLQQRRKQRQVQTPSEAEVADKVQWVEAVVGGCSRRKTELKPVAVGLDRAWAGRSVDRGP